jgi:nucleotide-binding universal stress UspA family protein
MSEYRKVLVAVDGSDAGTNALRQACRLSTSCSVTALTAYPSLIYDEVEGISAREKFSNALREEAERVIGEAKRLAAAESLGLADTLTAEGEPFEVIVDAARRGRFDLIVMGRRGLTRFERALLGSVAARVIGHAETDVLVIPRGATVAWERILVPTDGSRHSRRAMEKAIELAKAYRAPIDIVSVVDAADEFQFAETPANLRDLLAVQARGAVEALRSLAAGEGVAAETFVLEGAAHEAIAAHAAGRKASVVVMGSHGRTGLRRLLMGSVAEKVIGAVACPVLIARV